MIKQLGKTLVLFIFIGAVNAAENNKQAATAATLELGKKLSMICITCHGITFQSRNATPYVPALAGQHADYTMAQILAYRKGERQGAMSSHMKIPSDVYSDEEYRAIATYLESLGEK